jgi:hypothetical protein
MSGMYAMTSLNPVNTMDDYLYHFPISNVSANGSVCTGSLPLGEFGYINVKSYVEKMSGFFWNNRFNADITSGPQVYGDKNCLGNWFEWEYKSYIDPASILALDFSDDTIKNTRKRVGNFVYNPSSSSDSSRELRISVLQPRNLLECFNPSTRIGDSYVSLESGEAKRHFNDIATSIEAEGYIIDKKTIIKTDTKKFKIISFDGYKTYNVSDSSLIENDIVVTHVILKDEKGRKHSINLKTNRGMNFLLKAYRKARNYIEEAQINDVTFNIGDVVCIRLAGDFDSNVNVDFDVIKSIRENSGTFLFEFHKREKTIVMANDTQSPEMRPVEFYYGTTENPITDDEIFSYRTQKLLDVAHTPVPYSVRDHLSEIQKACCRFDKCVFEDKRRHYGYSGREKLLYVYYLFERVSSADPDPQRVELTLCERSLSDDKASIFLPLPSYVTLSDEEFEEIIPTINGSETVIIGQEVYQAISYGEEPEEIPLKIMRDNDGEVSISTVRQAGRVMDNMLFRPCSGHIKNTISEIDGVKTFKIRDLYECGTDREFITFKVGDEVLTTTDWSPSRGKSPSIKKIHDFITVEDTEFHSLVTGTDVYNDGITSGMSSEHTGVIEAKYNEYIKSSGRKLKRGEDCWNKSFNSAFLYAVLDDGTDELTFHPLISSHSQHYLNGIAHVKKEVGNLKAQDFIKANVGKIPYFAKKLVDEIVGFVDINGRDLAVLKNGLTMWADIIESHFKVFKRDKLTDTKIQFYEEKVREPDMNDFMLLYGDMYMGQVGIPLLTSEEHAEMYKDEESASALRKSLYENVVDIQATTLRATKAELEELKELNGDCNFKSIIKFIPINKMLIRYDMARGSVRARWDLKLASPHNSGEHLGIYQNHPKTRFYDLCYAVYNRSLTNGAAYMPMRDAFLDPMVGYRYYSSPFTTSEIWFQHSNCLISLLTFPTPRMLKNKTRKKESYIGFKQLGPQNRFYNKLSSSDMDSYTGRQKIRNEDAIYNITSDNILPSLEED